MLPNRCHLDTGTKLWEEPAICHRCDEAIDAFDVKCFSCQTDRSRYNRRLYMGPSLLPMLPETPPESESEDEGSLADLLEDDHEGEEDHEDMGGRDGGSGGGSGGGGKNTAIKAAKEEDDDSGGYDDDDSD